MQYTAEERAIIWLCACTAFDYRSRVALLRAAKNPAELLKADENFFDSVLKLHCAGLYTKSGAERESELNAFLEGLDRKEQSAVTLVSELYPELLLQISQPPLVLYLSGNTALLKEKKFAIVGARITPSWAEKTGKIIAEELSSRFVIVTGLAEGGDSAAIAGALKSGKLISVLPCGLNECYPASHASLKEKVRRSGLLVSEYLPNERVTKFAFHARNRILAGLSAGVLILSAAKRSGTLITASCALESGRDVFALPHNVGSAQGEGCNDLIKKGAYLCTSSEDIFFQYGMQPALRQNANLPATESRILEVLKEYGELHTAEIADRSGMKIYEASAALSALEIKNLVVRAGGNRYAAL